jgi:integrase/recombinase XerC
MEGRKRTRVLDSRGRPVAGLYTREGHYIAGFNCPQTGRWRMVTLAAETLTEARRERDALLAGLRDGRTRAPSEATLDDLFRDYQEARNLSERTRTHERHLFARHLAPLADRRAQDVTAAELARVMRGLRDRYAPWTCVAVHRLVRGSFALAVRRGILTRSPADGLAPSEVPRQRNARRVEVLDADTLARLVGTAPSERWRAALGLAGFGGLRLGEIRALTWGDVSLDAGAIAVSCSMLPDGTVKATKTAAGARLVPILPALRRVLVEWRLRSPHTRPDDPVVCTAEGEAVQERNIRRALDDAKAAAGLTDTEGRLSLHALRHSCLSALATGGLAATTLAEIAGHTDPGFTLRCYARDGRPASEVVADVLARAAGAGFGR